MKGRCIYFILSVTFSAFVETAPLNNDVEFSLKYLQDYGYLKKDYTFTSMDDNVLQESIMKLQDMFGIETTGKLSDELMAMMNEPRCGVFDIDPEASGFMAAGSKWRKNRLTYNIYSYPAESKLKKAQVDSEVRRAFDKWTSYVDLSITRSQANPDIKIYFQKGDGAGKVLGYAYFPENGKVVFDNSEFWVANRTKGSDLYDIAAHEFGHILGLGHSQVKGALMYPTYSGYTGKYTNNLSKDDIKGIQSIYENKVPMREMKVPQICNKIDSITRVKNSFYIFRNNRVIVVNLKDGSSQNDLISNVWKGANQESYDAVFYFNFFTYFIKGSNVWKYSAANLVNNYPKPISEVFKGIPNNINTVTVINNRRLFFYKGNQYWQFNTNRNPPASSPSNVDTIISGLPSNLDATVSYRNKYYFFKNDKAYVYNPNTKKLGNVNIRDIFKC